MKIEGYFEEEYKRRFLVNQLPSYININSLDEQMVKVNYLNKVKDSLDVEYINIDDDKYYLFIFDDGLQKRNKIIIDIDEDRYRVGETLSTPKNLTIKKYDFTKSNSDYKINLLVYTNLNTELMIVEVEGERDDIIKFKPENWFSNEITNIPEYKNINLATFKEVKK